MSFLTNSLLTHRAMDRALEGMLLSGPEPHPVKAPPPIDLLLNRWYSDQERTVSLRRTLLDSLSHLEPEHADLVSDTHRKQLYFELQRKRNDPYLVCAILKGLAGMGDHAAVYDVIFLANGGGSASEFPVIQTTAREYLRALGHVL